MVPSSTASHESSPPDVAAEVDRWLGQYVPEVRDSIAALQAEAWAAVDPTLLELARLRIAMLQGDDAEFARRSPLASLDAGQVAVLGHWPDAPEFSERERAVLAFTELFVGDVSSITTDDTDALLEHLEPAECYALVAALLAFDEHQRLRLALNRVFGPED